MHVLRAQQLFDGERFLGPGDVVVDRGRVVAVTPASPPSDSGSDAGPTPELRGATVHDLGAATLLPGLVDAHQHLSWDCSPDPVAWHRQHDDATLREQTRANARRALAAGITTVRDLGSRRGLLLTVRDETAADPASGPTLLAAGAPLTTPGGHCHFLGGECHTVEDLVAEVGRQVAAGVDVVKVMATGGRVTPGSSPGASQFDADALRAVVGAAHAAGRPVAAHAHGRSGVADALTAGVDTIEHCSFMTDDAVEQDPELVARVAASGVAVSVTAGMMPGMPGEPGMQALLPQLVAHVGRLIASGARCILSTDAGIGPAKPHDVLPHAVLQAVQLAGLPPARALAMCTSLAAEALGLSDGTGRLRPGSPADVLAVDGLLDTDPTAILRPVRVLHRGVEVASAPAPTRVTQDADAQDPLTAPVP